FAARRGAAAAAPCAPPAPAGPTPTPPPGERPQQTTAPARRARDRGRSLTNLVMMGMGEPFHNYDATMKLAAILNDHHGLGFGARRITISTSGVVPMIDKLAAEPYQVNLAVSLHAPDDDLRSRLVPINRR